MKLEKSTNCEKLIKEIIEFLTPIIDKELKKIKKKKQKAKRKIVDNVYSGIKEVFSLNEFNKEEKRVLRVLFSTLKEQKKEIKKVKIYTAKRHRCFFIHTIEIKTKDDIFIFNQYSIRHNKNKVSKKGIQIEERERISRNKSFYSQIKSENKKIIQYKKNLKTGKEEWY